MSSGNAWLLECSSQLTVAVSDHEIIECIQSQREYPVPLAPHYCNSVVAWQNRLVPVMDLALAIGAGDSDVPSSIVCLLNYQQAPRQPLQQLALRVGKTPEKIYVDDAQAAEPSDDPAHRLLDPVALSCFLHGRQTVAVIDIAKLCAAEFRELAQSFTAPLASLLPASEPGQVDSR
jgi:chemotaxis signal transduction protein